MNISIRRNLAGFLLIYALLGALFSCLWLDIPDIYFWNYGILLLAYFIDGGITFFMWSSGKIKFFDPFTIISFLYMMILVIYPMYDYTQLNVYKSGVDTSSGCIKGTIIFMVSYLFFCIGYFFSNVKDKGHHYFKIIERLSSSEMTSIALVCWIISFAGAMAGQISRGFSWNFILSMGAVGQDDILVNSSSGGLLFLLMLIPTMIVSEVMILNYSKNPLLKTVTFILTFVFLFMRGGRMLMIDLVAAPVVLWYLKRKKSPSTSTICAAFASAIVLFAVLQVSRVDISQGQDFRENLMNNIFSVETYMSVFDSDFSTYKVYYGIVNTFPDQYDFLYGRGMIGYTMALIVPRALWPDKPDAPEREVVYDAMGQEAMDNGNAYPNIGIFYSEFGILGTVILMFLYGVIMSKSRKLYKIESESALILYACLWPFCFQLTTRSFSDVVYTLLFGFLPMFICWFLSGSKRKDM
ncbi:O-antigen polysaccharide polymerase Wzy [Megasphaera sp. AM44-1BH]|uniref:O-antigen polymerase n=1 Tax=Megasphaera sp. AM44-1BH TaxID=2292358 RepID=UPI000E4A96E3|nr:O-antigen polymerase [Megasphaera sp. AM44-1BH]RHA09993.1 O-antigen polysaccharide polymerase Wzy [Megasphaera sp. AM44-1BH]